MTLHRAATNGDLEAVRAAIGARANIDARDEYDFTPLMLAARSDHAKADILRLLVESGADLEAIRKNKYLEERPLSLAIKGGDLDKIKFLVDAGAVVTYCNEAGYDATIDSVYSAYSSDDALVRMFLDLGGRPDRETRYGETALKVAARNARVEVVRLLIERGAKESDLNWSALAKATMLGSLADVEAAIAAGGDHTQRDVWDRTPFMLALESGDIDKAKRIFREGVDLEERGFSGKTAVSAAAGIGNAKMIDWLADEGFSPETSDDFELTPLMRAVSGGHVDAVRTLLRRGAKLDVELGGSSAMSCAKDRTTLGVLLAEGGELSKIDDDMRRVLRGHTNDEPKVTRAEYDADRTRRFGDANPTPMSFPFWRWMVWKACNAYQGSKELGDDSSFGRDPVWCYDRFGRTITLLEDGSLVETGGEHEDYYDPDFCIYNDVVVHRPDGSFVIYGYPEKLFPPTDFHSATLFGGSIILIGSLGYAGNRAYSSTPSFRLDCTTFAIGGLDTTGDPPGWIYRHRARLVGRTIEITGGKIVRLEDEKETHVDNIDTFTLNLDTLDWRKS